MEDQNKHTDRLDDFSRIIQERLKDHRLPLQGAGWEEMEQKLRNQRIRKSRKSLLWVAAALIPLLLFLPFRWFSDDEKERVAQPEINRSLSEEISSFTGVTDESEQPEVIIPAPLPPVLSQSDTLKVSEPIIDQEVADDSEEKQVIPSYHDPVLVPFRRAGDLIVDYIPAKRKSSSWSVGAGVGAGGGVSLSFATADDEAYYSGNDGYYPSHPNPPSHVNPDRDDEIIPGHYNDCSYSIPFSVSFSVRKQFNERVGIETGIQYTYLATRFDSYSTGLRNARNDLHYLGIPVNLVVTAWVKDNWSFYLSAGVTFEKGIRQTIHKYGRPGPFPEDSHVGKSIPGVQWSLNFAPGLSYRIVKEWNLYVEPRLSYYFDNDQPYSIRVDKPTVIGIAGGLRYSF